MTSKKVLFVINTLGRAGAETSLLEVLKRFDKKNNSVYLYVLTGQGELGAQLPEEVTLLNPDYEPASVLTSEGKKLLAARLLGRPNGLIKLLLGLPYLIKHLFIMLIKGCFLPDKLLWRYVSDSSPVFDMEFDLAVAFLEGGSAYYTAEHVKAKTRTAFIHIDYGRAGYYRSLDRDCYRAFDRIYAVSQDVRKAFLLAYPELESRVELFNNMLDRDGIYEKSRINKNLKWEDSGFKILSVGRLTSQKNYSLSIDAMKILKSRYSNIKWYVLGEGEERNSLWDKIKREGLTESFILLGSVDNPYPYIAGCDVFVHATSFEGKSIAVEEARLLGKAIVISNTSGNHDQIRDGVDGLYCKLDPLDVFNKVSFILDNPKFRRHLEFSAADGYREHTLEHEKLVELLG